MSKFLFGLGLGMATSIFVSGSYALWITGVIICGISIFVKHDALVSAPETGDEQ